MGYPSISVFIPCVPKHFKYLKNVIDSYVKGTVRALEIVVFLSGTGCDTFESPSKHCRFFSVPELVRAGPARQQALELCKGDVVVYQDADDFPHRQRVETVRRVFKDNDIVLLTSVQSFKIEDLDTNINYQKIKKISGKDIYHHYFPSGKITDCSRIYKAYGGDLVHMNSAGDPCIRRCVLETVKWKDNKDLTLLGTKNIGEDYEFCMEVTHKFKKSMIIDSVLVWYKVY